MPALDTFIALLLMFTTIAFGVFDCARRIALGMPARKWGLALFGLTLLSVALGTGGYMLKEQMATLSTGMEKTVSAPAMDKFSQVTLDTIAEVTKRNASRDFFWRGVLSEHTKVDGTRVLFQPSQEDLKMREQYLSETTTVELISAVFENWAFAFWAMPILSAALGFLAGRGELRGKGS